MDKKLLYNKGVLFKKYIYNKETRFLFVLNTGFKRFLDTMKEGRIFSAYKLTKCLHFNLKKRA